MAGMQFTYELEQSTYEALKKRLEEIAGNKARVYIARALNKTATTTRVKMIGKMQAAYTVKTGGAKSDLRITNANAGNLIAYIRSNGSTLAVNKFHWSPGGKSGAKIDVVRSGLKPIVKYGNKAFVNKGAGGNVFVRQSSSRLPIEKIKSKSVPFMYGSHRVWTPMAPEVQANLEKYMLQQINMLLGGG